MAARPGLATAFRDAFLSALVALGLFGAMIGLKTDSGATSLVLVGRPWAVLMAVGAVFAGRLALLGWRAWRRCCWWRRSPCPPMRDATGSTSASWC